MSEDEKKQRRAKNNESVRKCRENEKLRIESAKQKLAKSKQDYKELQQKYEALQKELETFKSLFQGPIHQNVLAAVSSSSSTSTASASNNMSKKMSIRNQLDDNDQVFKGLTAIASQLNEQNPSTSSPNPGTNNSTGSERSLIRELLNEDTDSTQLRKRLKK